MIIGIIGLVIFLFVLFQLVRDDFVFLRKNVSVEQMFNLTFIGLPVVLFSARIFYVVSHPSWQYINPLIFFVVPYFPGLSLPGGIVGGLIYIAFFAQKKKLPLERMLDVLSLSFLISLAISGGVTLIIDVLLKNITLVEDAILSIGSFIAFLFLVNAFLKGKWADGLVGSLILVVYCFLQMISYSVLFFLTHHLPSLGAIATLLILFIFSLFLLLRKGKFLFRTGAKF